MRETAARSIQIAALREEYCLFCPYSQYIQSQMEAENHSRGATHHVVVCHRRSRSTLRIVIMNLLKVFNRCSEMKKKNHWEKNRATSTREMICGKCNQMAIRLMRFTSGRCRWLFSVICLVLNGAQCNLETRLSIPTGSVVKLVNKLQGVACKLAPSRLCW